MGVALADVLGAAAADRAASVVDDAPVGDVGVSWLHAMPSASTTIAIDWITDFVMNNLRGAV
ncbi:MAG: hypothetical protein LAO77_04675 [Acidobacteriia bacterium]|nr:hypothetical protein [Terriglobia bacterium]